MNILRRVFPTLATGPSRDRVDLGEGGGAETSAARHEVSVATTERDGERRTDIAVHDPAEKWAQVRVVILTGAPGDHRLFAAFGVSAIRVALPVDLPLQMAANDVAEEAMSTTFPEAAEALRASFRHLWQSERQRLEARWAHLAARGYCPETLLLHRTQHRTRPVIRYRLTRPGRDEVFGVEYHPGTQHVGSLRSFAEKTGDFVPVTQDALADVTTMSGHEKLSLLAEADGASPSVARDRFERERRRLGDARLRPLLGMEGLAVGPYVFFHNGDEGGVWARVHPKGEPTLRLHLDLPSLRSSIRFERTRDAQFVLGRGKTHENRFKSVALLDACVGRLIDLILAFDEVVPDAALPSAPPVFRADRPALAGRTIPARHQPLVATLLDKPYAQARQGADRFARTEAKKEGKANAVSDLAGEIADGALFGRVEIAPSGDIWDTWGRMRLMKLGQVRSSVSPAGRRRREIGGMAGWTAVRPLTPKNMARLPLVKDPDALRIVSDACLGHDRRDIVEGAFRLSFHLEGGARNPFLDTPAAFRTFAGDGGDPALRATSISVPAGPALLAIGATFPNRDRFHDEHKTGAGFMALRVAGDITFSARPAMTSDGWSAPEGHRRLIEAALTELTATGDWPQDRLLEGLETAWAAMAKTCGALPWP